ncbi:alpha/beta fold hydrolase BchO [Roseovarius aquimarinus]|uniref:Alpha/beta fold hydrolase BchO n=1 Tax=Roseovarius aquimarinus TaxID=1229156 RepID=A0ABW7I2Y7_9RHOB
MRWPEDAADWPLTEHSRRVLHRPHRWHVQEAGRGPTLLLIHGAGGATHSWRGLFPLLSERFHVVAVDLPGHGFTQPGARGRSGLESMTADLAALAAAEGWHPAAVIGHSAGAAIALNLGLRLGDPAPRIVTLNAALSNFEGVAGWLFPKLAKLLAATPFTADLFSAAASSQSNVARLIAGTGSQLDPEGLALYRRLVADRAHVDGTLAMMSQWSLDGLLPRLGEMSAPVFLMTGDADSAVPPAVSRRAAEKLPNARLESLPSLGHLMHEEDPEAVARLIFGFLEGIEGGPDCAAPQ